jgi:hypothetical protein
MNPNPLLWTLAVTLCGSLLLWGLYDALRGQFRRALAKIVPVLMIVIIKLFSQPAGTPVMITPPAQTGAVKLQRQQADVPSRPEPQPSPWLQRVRQHGADQERAAADRRAAGED